MQNYINDKENKWEYNIYISRSSRFSLFYNFIDKPQTLQHLILLKQCFLLFKILFPHLFPEAKLILFIRLDVVKD